MSYSRVLICSALVVGCVHGTPPAPPVRMVANLTCSFGRPIYLAVGDTFRLHAALIRIEYDDLTCTDSALPGWAWQSSSPEVVFVDSQGIAHARGVGRADVEALTRYGAARGECVVVPTIAHFGFGVDSIVAPLHARTPISVDPRDSSNRPIHAWVEYNWVGGNRGALGSIVGSDGPAVQLLPLRLGRAYLMGALGPHADTVLVVVRQ